MSTVIDTKYAASIEGRGLDHAERRAELSDMLFDRAEDLVSKLEALREILVGTCDGSLLEHEDPKKIGPLEVAFAQTVEHFDGGVKQIVEFLLREGGYKVEQISSAEAVVA